MVEKSVPRVLVIGTVVAGREGVNYSFISEEAMGGLLWGVDL